MFICAIFLKKIVCLIVLLSIKAINKQQALMMIIHLFLLKVQYR